MIRCALNQTKVFHVAGTLSNGRATVYVTCSTCGYSDAKQSKANMPPQALAKWFGSAGWDIDDEGKRAKCPKCARPTKKPGEVPIGRSVAPPPPADHEAKETTMMETESPSVEAARKQRVRAAAFGPLKDPEIVKIRAELQAALKRIEDERTTLTKLVREHSDRAVEIVNGLKNLLVKLEANGRAEP